MKIYKCRDVKTPLMSTDGSAGFDFYIPEDFAAQLLAAGEDINIPSGIHMKVPPGYVLIMFNKSGRAVNNKFLVGAQVIDSDYQGEVHLHVLNVGATSQVVGPGDKLVQGILLPYSAPDLVEMISLDDLYAIRSGRGTGGFGSTGLK